MRTRPTQRTLEWIVSVLVLFGTGCSHGLSSAIRQQVDTTLSMEQLQAAPDTYKDRVAMLGGEIVTTRNLPDGTRLEILQKPLDASGLPYDGDKSQGRFLAQCDTYLDPKIYTTGRQVTIAGRVLGTLTDKIGEADYVYPLISCLETRLWPKPPVALSPRYSAWSWWGGPPWPGPWWWRPYYRHHSHRRW